MADVDLILQKAGRTRTHIARVQLKCGDDLSTFMSDTDRQDIVAFNLHMAIQNCIDIASHLISEEGWGVPGSTSEMFYMLEDHGCITVDTTEKMVKAVGFRNLLVHQYGQIDLQRVFTICRKDVQDLMTFLSEIFIYLQLEEEGERP